MERKVAEARILSAAHRRRHTSLAGGRQQSGWESGRFTRGQTGLPLGPSTILPSDPQGRGEPIRPEIALTPI